MSDDQQKPPTEPPGQPNGHGEPPPPEAPIISLSMVRGGKKEEVYKPGAVFESVPAHPASLDRLRAQDMDLLRALAELGKLTEEEMNIKKKKMVAMSAVEQQRAMQARLLELAAASSGINTTTGAHWLLDFATGVWNRVR